MQRRSHLKDSLEVVSLCVANGALLCFITERIVCSGVELVNISCLLLGLAVVKINQTAKMAGLRLPLDVSALYVTL